jgi:hypothetical protein
MMLLSVMLCCDYKSELFLNALIVEASRRFLEAD